MRLSKFIAGLLILQKYYNKDGYHIGAEHDEIFVYKTDKPLSQDDFRKMIELGWRQVDDDDEDSVVYNPNSNWSVYV